MARESMYGGVDMKMHGSHKSAHHMAGKSHPRKGAAHGQGNGMGGYDHSSVHEAMGEVEGAASPVYYSPGSEMKRK